MEDYFKGAAPYKKNYDWSNPNAYFILFKIKKLAKLYIYGAYYPFYCPKTF